MLAVGGYEYPPRLSLWKPSASELLPVHDWESGMILLSDVAFAPDGLTLFAGGPTTPSVRPYNISVPTQPRRLPILEDSDGPLAVSLDGR